jgi:hypothetical protein
MNNELNCAGSMYWVDCAMVYLLHVTQYWSAQEVQRRLEIPHSTVGEIHQWMKKKVHTSSMKLML